MEIVTLVIGVVLGMIGGFFLGTWYCRNIKGMK